MIAAMPSIRRLLIISHVVHYQHGGRLYAYAPYAREIDIWADLFPEVEIAAPCRHQPPPADTTAFTRANIQVSPQPETGGDTLQAKARQLLQLPQLLYSLSLAMAKAGAIHVRCPGNLGLLGVLLAPLFSRRRVAKYAGQWTGYPGEPLTVRLQRSMLRSRWWGAPVTVYGRWPDQPAHVIPFFTSMLTAEQMAQAQRAAENKKTATPLRILFVGRLSTAKNVATILSALAALQSRDIPALCTIIGDGPEMANLRRQAQQLAIDDRVHFAGSVEFEEVLDYYGQADVLVLVSESEGWPKAITEAMAFGLVCIGSDRGLVPEILGEGRGITIPPGDVEALAGALCRVAQCPEEATAMSARAAAWSRYYSLEGLREALQELLAEHWDASFAGRDGRADVPP